MKVFSVTSVFSLLAALSASSQGTLVYDQQSSANETTVAGGPILQRLSPPYGQSFTPSLSSVEFIRLAVYDAQPGNAFGATLYVNLRIGSIGGTILGSTAPISFSDGSATFATFFFGGQVPLTPGQVYYFQPVAQSGDLWGVTAGGYNYPGGSAFDNGVAGPGSDYWFREGIIIPEPSSAALVLFGAAAFASFRRSARR